MPSLLQLLQSQDLGHLHIIASLWGIEIQPDDLETGAQNAAYAMLDPQLVHEIIETLDRGAREALTVLIHSAGRMPWAGFVRQFGDVRDMGAARRDRELPHLHPSSAAEVLFYRGLLGRAFFDTGTGLQEFAYIPEDLLHLLQKSDPPSSGAHRPPGRPAAAAERSIALAASDRVLDDATTLLAALRIDHQLPDDPVLRQLLENAGILDNAVPQAARVKAFLEVPRGNALQMLVDGWRSSETFNELRLVPSLICEGTWANEPRPARQFILHLLEAIPPNTWWSLQAFLDDIRRRQPDFQRPAGDYDSWYIKSAADSSYLRGFSNWNHVEGALIRFLIADVMHRLGLLDLARPGPDAPWTAFRLVEPRVAQDGAKEDGKLHIGSQGRITASRRVSRAVRYQLARFCEWEDEREDEYRYQATPRSLTRARQQALTVEHLITLLVKHSEAGVPPAVVKALKRWEAHGTEARLEAQVVLKTGTPGILERLRTSKAAKYLGEALGPASVIVKAGAVQKVVEAMVGLGLLVDDRTTPTTLDGRDSSSE